MFGDVLQEHFDARARIRGFETPQGSEVVLWLVVHGGQVPLKNLYRSSRYSGWPTRSRTAQRSCQCE